MSDAYHVKPDRKFTAEVIRLGGESVKKCYQCATCSVVCDVSPDDRPFPRKEMIWAQWGLKDRLLGDPDVWLCHRCNDCSVRCPRDAAPGDVMAALRDFQISHYATPWIVGKIFTRGWLGFAAAIVVAIVCVYGLIEFAQINNLGDKHTGYGFAAATHEATWDEEAGRHEVEYSAFLPHNPLIAVYSGLLGLSSLALLIGVVRFWKDMTRINPGVKPTNFVKNAIATVLEIAFHQKFKKCTDRKKRSLSHLLTLGGFIGLFITTAFAVLYLYVLHRYPIPLSDPLKWFGNASALAMATGLGLIVWDKASATKKPEGTTAADMFFILILCLVVLTGIATEVLRYAHSTTFAYDVYFVHLVVVFCLLIYVPYTRFAHMVYRSVAIFFAKCTGRD